MAVTREEMISIVKKIVVLGKESRHDEVYTLYRDLFADPGFTQLPGSDQRKALELMILTKQKPSPEPASFLEAHRAALGPVSELLGADGEPSDHELLGVCHVRLGNEAAASNIFKAGLQIERARGNSASNLCGRLMNRVSAL